MTKCLVESIEGRIVFWFLYGVFSDSQRGVTDSEMFRASGKDSGSIFDSRHRRQTLTHMEHRSLTSTRVSITSEDPPLVTSDY